MANRWLYSSKRTYGFSSSNHYISSPVIPHLSSSKITPVTCPQQDHPGAVIDFANITSSISCLNSKLLTGLHHHICRCRALARLPTRPVYKVPDTPLCTSSVPGDRPSTPCLYKVHSVLPAPCPSQYFYQAAYDFFMHQARSCYSAIGLK